MNDLIQATDCGFDLFIQLWQFCTSNIIFSIVLLLILLPKFFKLFQKIRQ